MRFTAFLVVFFLWAVPSSCNETNACGSNDLLCNVTCNNKTVGESASCSLLDNHTAGWKCCLCDINQTRCCKSCPSSKTTAAPVEYLRILVIFFDRCSEYVKKKQEFNNSFRSSVANLTNIHLDILNVDGINCSEGPKPYCGMQLENIQKHSRARRAVGGGRGRGGGTDKKQGSETDSLFFKHYYNMQEPDCEGLAVNATMKIPERKKMNKTLELMISQLNNRTFNIEVYDGSILTAELMLAAEKGLPYSRYKAPPLPTFYPPMAPKKVPSLKTDLRPLIFTAGSILALVTLYVVIRLIKHSIFLRMKKFTKINSDKTRKKVLKADVEKKQPKAANMFITPYDTTLKKPLQVNNESLSHSYDWSTAGYFPNVLAPAYRPAGLSSQHATPKLMLDESDHEDGMHYPNEGESVIDLNVDESFDDILQSDSEEDGKQKRPGTTSRSLGSGRSTVSQKSNISDKHQRKNAGYSKTRNRVSPTDMRGESALGKSSMQNSSV